jgi:RNA polymerase sigma-B factor
MSSSATLPPERTARHDPARLFARYRRDHDPATRDALVARFLPLAYHLARRYHGGADADDLQQVASIGLLKAIDRYDPERGSAFSSFAVPTILGELKRYFRDNGWTVRVPRDLQDLKLRIDGISQTLTGELGRSPTPAELAERANTTTEQILDALAAATAHHPDSLDQPLGDEGHDAIHFLAAKETGFERVDNTVFVDELLNTLSDRERIILRLRFEHDLTQAEIGARLGISQMQISRLIRQAIATLRDAARSDVALHGPEAAHG